MAREFDHFEMGEDQNVLSIDKPEMDEKWEYFNLIFWKVLDWKGTAVEFDNMRYQRHCDKTRIFYALQMTHTNQIWKTVDQIKKLYSNYYGRVTMLDYALMFN